MSGERFREALLQAGITAEKPLHTILTTLHETAQEAREVVGKGARGLSPQGEKELIQKIADHSADATHKEIERLALRVGVRNALAMTLVGLSLIGGGYLWGSWHPDQKGFLGQLETQNDMAEIARHCHAHAVKEAGGTACELGMAWVARAN